MLKDNFLILDKRIKNFTRFNVSSDGYVNVETGTRCYTNDLDNYIRKEIQSTFMELQNIISDFNPDYHKISTELEKYFGYSKWVTHYRYRFGILPFDFFYPSYNFGFSFNSKDVYLGEGFSSRSSTDVINILDIDVGPLIKMETSYGVFTTSNEEIIDFIEKTELKYLFNFLTPNVERLNLLLKNYNSIIARYPYNQKNGINITP